LCVRFLQIEKNETCIFLRCSALFLENRIDDSCQ